MVVIRSFAVKLGLAQIRAIGHLVIHLSAVTGPTVARLAICLLPEELATRRNIGSTGRLRLHSGCSDDQLGRQRHVHDRAQMGLSVEMGLSFGHGASQIMVVSLLNQAVSICSGSSLTAPPLLRSLPAVSAEARRGAAGNAQRARAAKFVLSFRSNSADLLRFQVLILFVATHPRLKAVKIKIDHRGRVECEQLT